MKKNLDIQPSTKVAALLEEYPELEDVLIGIAPPFKKLKNPFVRKSVAKVTTLQQAAAVGRVSLTEMIHTLRTAVGQGPLKTYETGGAESYFESQPAWFDENKIVAIIDEQTADADSMPVIAILRKATTLAPGEIIELHTTFLPAPGIDIMKSKGYLVWATEDKSDSVKTYFSKPVDRA
jgi:TusA-related sulfurtransferase